MYFAFSLQRAECEAAVDHRTESMFIGIMSQGIAANPMNRMQPEEAKIGPDHYIQA